MATIVFIIGICSAFYLGRWFEYWWPREKFYRKVQRGEMDEGFARLEEADREFRAEAAAAEAAAKTTAISIRKDN